MMAFSLPNVLYPRESACFRFLLDVGGMAGEEMALSHIGAGGEEEEEDGGVKDG